MPRTSAGRCNKGVLGFARSWRRLSGALSNSQAAGVFGGNDEGRSRIDIQRRRRVSIMLVGGVFLFGRGRTSTAVSGHNAAGCENSL